MTKETNKKTIRSWALFDWANSAFALVITVAVFPVYFSSTSPETVEIFGTHFTSSTIYSYSISIAYLLIAFASPLFAGIADYAGKRLYFLKFFTILGSLACFGLFFFSGANDWWIGIVSFMLGIIGFAGGLVFYNSFLPIITTEENYDQVSAKGFAYGYIGSVLILIFNLLMIQKPDWFGLQDAGFASRVVFLTIGCWWLVFGFISFRHLPKDLKKPIELGHIRKGYLEVYQVSKELIHKNYMIRFLASFFFYIAGVQTVLFLASTFAEKELLFSSSELILTILILQVLAIGGAYLFAYISKIKGNKFSLFIMISIWLLICGVGYFLQTKVPFYILAGFVGLVMGGIQSQSRSTYSKLMDDDEDDVTSYFSFYDLVEKLAIVAGTFSFGMVEQLTGGLRNSLLALSIFFLIGMLLLLTVKTTELK